MGRIVQEPWYNDAAEYCTRWGVPLEVALTELGIDSTHVDIRRTLRTKGWQVCLSNAANRMFIELANDPTRNKLATIGRMQFSIDKLLESKDYDKALEGMLKLAKLEGWVGADTSVSVYEGLSDKDLKELRAKLEGEVAAQAQVN